MPQFFYVNGLGNKTQIWPEAVSRSQPNFFHCRLSANPDTRISPVTLHKNSILTTYSPEEIANYQLQQRRRREEVIKQEASIPPLV